MSAIDPVIKYLHDLISDANTTHELHDNIYLEGDESSADRLEAFIKSSRNAGFEFFFHEFDVHGEKEVSENSRPVKPWSMSVGKKPLIDSFLASENALGATLLFLTKDAFEKWCISQLIPSETFLDWPERLTILVFNLASAVIGPNLRIAPVEHPLPDFSNTDNKNFPSDELARESGHFSGRQDNRTLTKISITSGDVELAIFGPVLQWAELDAACLLAEETIKRESGWVAIIRGENRLELPLGADLSPPSFDSVRELEHAVDWVFQDNSMARHAILSNRLAADRDAAPDFRSLLRTQLTDTLKQAKDRYRFFVLNKTDKAAEELRDTIEKIKTQADVYAARSSQLALMASRDFLASILIVGFGVITRIKSSPDDLLHSNLAATFFFSLGIYFLSIPALRILIQIADLWASEQEANKWISAAQKNLPTGELKNTFEAVFKRRRWIYGISVAIVIILNVAMSVIFFKWKVILASILNT